MRSRSLAARLAEVALGHERHHVEVRPPERAGQHQPEQGPADDARVELPLDTGADRDDRLSERDDHDQREALREVAGRDPEAPHPEHERSGEVDRERRDPQERLRRPVEERGDDQQRRCRKGGAGEAPDGVGRVDVVVRLGEDEDVKPAGDRVGDREQEGVVTERVGHRQRRDEEGAHHGEHEQALAVLLGGDVVREPGVRAPGPPERGEHQHPLAESRPARVLRHQLGDLCQRKDEDEVEEQFERCNALFAGIGHLADKRSIKCRTVGSMQRLCVCRPALRRCSSPRSLARAPPSPRRAAPRSPSSARA